MKQLTYLKILEILKGKKLSTNEILTILIHNKLFTTYETLRKDLAYMYSKQLISYEYGYTDLKKIPYKIYFINPNK